MRTLFRSLVLSLCLAVAAAAPAGAAETIKDYRSRIEVGADGALTVTETIVVQAEGAIIQHGIYRDFPNLYIDRAGVRRATGFELLSVQRDSRDEPWHSERRSNGLRVYVGSASTNVPAGIHTYEMVYRTDRQLGFFADHDELYWNVTGNGWAFPVERASAEVVLPMAAHVTRVEAYTGPAGARERNYTSVQPPDRPNTAEFATTRALRAGEGLTIVVGWPVGVIARPSVAQRTADVVWLNLSLLVGALGLAGTLAYYLWAWMKVGRDPPTGTIIPLYEPPAGLSPAAVRYVRRMRFDQRCFAANLIGLAVKGYLKIHQYGGSVAVSRMAGTAPLTPDEAAMQQGLFVRGERFTFDTAGHERFAAVFWRLREGLVKAAKPAYFSRNTGYLLAGLPLGLLPLPAFLAGPGLLAFLFAVGGVASVIVFGFLLPAPSRVGRAILDRIEGFKRYLAIAEKDRLNLENPPRQTPELYDKFLPYALALGVEQQWSEQFAAALRAAEIDPRAQQYSPAWYVGPVFSPSQLGNFGGVIASSLGGAIAAASIAPGSSSGFSGGGGAGGGGGGGSSGGGGGGGGGGGW